MAAQVAAVFQAPGQGFNRHIVVNLRNGRPLSTAPSDECDGTVESRCAARRAAFALDPDHWQAA
ncbi:hypothetical protein [Methylobacterium sp. P1-11]|uniref:hypothetical protein n=1 Tax=Methylobacterium sp. P1-11 TaxID=2024616 RepID=UPI0011EE53BB|nr:hypothetical protein [Methylobacterium sp. P1-11]